MKLKWLHLCDEKKCFVMSVCWRADIPVAGGWYSAVKGVGKPLASYCSEFLQTADELRPTGHLSIFRIHCSGLRPYSLHKEVARVGNIFHITMNQKNFLLDYIQFNL
jgi:hypothetical protein